MESKDFSLIALALRTAKTRALGAHSAAQSSVLAAHTECVETLANALEARFGRKFNKESFIRESGAEQKNSAQAVKEGQTRRVNCLKEPYDVYIGRGRGSIWGNPFSHKASTLAEFHVASRDEAVDKHMAWLRQQKDLLSQLPELKGKRLGCFCNPDERCHGDNLIKLIEELIP